MTSEEIYKEMTEKALSQYDGDLKLTKDETTIWLNGYFKGCLKGIKYATALVDEKFKTTLIKGEEKQKGNDK